MSEAVTLARDLLPRDEATAWMRNHLAAMIGAWGLDIEALERERDANRALVENLPFLSFDGGNLVWSDAWPEDRKRWVGKNAIPLALLQGTPLGVEIAINLADGTLIEERLPPGRAFALPDTGHTRAELEALMPQLRLYHRWPGDDMPDLAFAGRQFAGDAFVAFDRARRPGRYPVLWDRGVKTPLGQADVSVTATTVTLHPPGSSGYGAFAGVAFAGDAFAAPAEVGKPITFDLDDPSMRLVKAPQTRPVEVAAAGASYAGEGFAVADLGDEDAYDMLILFDADRIPQGLSASAAGAFAGHNVLGVRPYEIALKVTIPGSPSAVPLSHLYAGAGFAHSYDNAPLAFLMGAINATRRAGDRILVQPVPSPVGAERAVLPSIMELS